MKKRTQAISLTIIAGFVCAYLAIWAYSAKWFDQEINKLYADAEKNGVRFLGTKPTLSNFPFVPEVYYTGGIQTGNTMLLFPEAKLRGYPIPGLTMHVSFPKGISLDGIADPKIWMLDELNAGIAVPYKIPANFERESLQTWKDNGGKIDLRYYDMKKAELSAGGKGFLELDDNLQPVFSLESRILHYESFVKSQIDKSIIEPFTGAIGLTLLNNLAGTDEKTGEKMVHVTVSVRDRFLYAGPLQVLQLPEIVWDTHMQPVPPQ